MFVKLNSLFFGASKIKFYIKIYKTILNKYIY